MFTELKNAVASLMEVINANAKTLLETANARKEALAKAEADLERSRAEINEFVGVVEELAKVGIICGDMICASGNIDDIVDGLAICEANLEDFDGYCDICGAEITRSDEAQVIDEDGLICAECAKAKAENAL